MVFKRWTEARGEEEKQALQQDMVKECKGNIFMLFFTEKWALQLSMHFVMQDQMWQINSMNV